MTSGPDAPVEPDTDNTTRNRVVDVALQLLIDHGPAALSTRAVCRAADVQAPTIYRIFGHKQGLIDAATARGFAVYATEHSVGTPCSDPVDGLRRGWNLHVQFALDHPTLYVLIYGQPRPGPQPPAAAHAGEMLGRRIRRVAEAGRLRLAEKYAAALLQAGARGTALTLIGTPEDLRDLEISHLARESLISTITTGPAPAARADLISAALQVRAALPMTTALTPRETSLLEEWIDRITVPTLTNRIRAGEITRRTAAPEGPAPRRRRRRPRRPGVGRPRGFPARW